MGVTATLGRALAALSTWRVEPPGRVALAGGREVAVAGESFYQTALEAASGGRSEWSARKKVRATLHPEIGNPHDPYAIGVRVGGQLVGYLPRETARRYRKSLVELRRRGYLGECAAIITGGWARTTEDGSDDRGYFGIVLDLAPPTKMLAELPEPATSG